MSKLKIEVGKAFIPLLEPARDKVARGGRGSGKSHFFASMLVRDCLSEPGACGGEGLRVVCLREVQKDLQQSAKLLIETKLKGYGLGEADGFKVYRDSIETPGDGIIIFKGMDDYSAEGLKSLEGFKRGWWEEAHTATSRSVDLYRPTMRASGSQMWWSYNPRRKVDPVDMMFTGPDLPTGALVATSTWRDNPWFSAEMEQERQDCLRLNPEQYDHIWEGGYATLSETAYFARQLTEAKNEGRIGKVARDVNMRIRAYWDIGGTGARADATAIWVVQFVGRQVLVLNYYEAQGQPLGIHLAWLRSNGYGDALCVLPHDGATNDKVYSVSFESAIREAGFAVDVVANQGKGAAIQRIEASRHLFGSVWFNDITTEAGREALGWYHERKDDRRGIGLGPNHDWSSHGADAFGLMATHYEVPVPRIRRKQNQVRRGRTAWMAR